MMNVFFEISKKVSVKFILLSLLFLLVSFLYIAPISANPINCVPEKDPKTNQLKEKCPPKSETRYDIKVQCIRDIADASCLDIMPVENLPNRISENLCYRDEGWTKAARDKSGNYIKDEEGNIKRAPNPRAHNGMDYGVSGPMKAAAAGVVEIVYSDNKKSAKGECKGNGRYVVISHTGPKSRDENGRIVESSSAGCFKSKYLHFSSIRVNEGDVVTKGEVLGEIGGSACSKGVFYDAYPVHAHFELSTCNNTVLDPMCPDIMKLCGDDNPIDTTKCRDCTVSYSRCPDSVKAGIAQAFTSGELDRPYQAPTTFVTDSNISRQVEPEVHGNTCNVQNYRNTFTTCIFCDIFKVIFNVSTEVAAKAFNTLTNPTIVIMMLGLAIWIALKLLTNLSSLQIQEPAQLLQELLNKIFLALVLLAFLYLGSRQIFNFLIAPIFNTGMKLALLTAEGGNICNHTVTTINDGGAIPEEIGINMLCVIQKIQDMLLDVMSVGSTFICLGLKDGLIKLIFVNLPFLITGIAFWIIALLILIIYPWLLVDTVLGMAVACALLPAAVGAYLFEPTRGYSKKVWSSFFNTMLNFLFLTLIIFIIINMLNNTIAGHLDEIKAIDENTGFFTGAVDKLLWWSTTFLKIAFVVLIGYSVLRDSSSLADEFEIVPGGGGGMGVKGIGSDVGTTFMSATKEITKSPRQLAWKGLGNLRREGWNRTKSAAHNLNMMRTANNIKNSNNTTVDADGNFIRTRKSWLKGKEITETLSTGSNGKPLLEKTVVGKKHTTKTSSDNIMQKTQKIDNKTGQVVYNATEIKAASAKRLLNKDGKINKVAMATMLQKSAFSEEDVYTAMAEKTLEQRHGDSASLLRNFDERKTTIVEEDGRKVIYIEQKTANGGTQKVRIGFGDERIKSSIETINSKGHSETLESDGILNRSVSRRYDENGNSIEKYEKEQFSVANKYVDDKVIGSIHGNTNSRLEKEMMHSRDELDRAEKQVKKFGKLQTDSRFKR